MKEIKDYLLSKSFALFNLIDSGLAIDATVTEVGSDALSPTLNH
jgi:hypothetical protein